MAFACRRLCPFCWWMLCNMETNRKPKRTTKSNGNNLPCCFHYNFRNCYCFGSSGGYDFFFFLFNQHSSADDEDRHAVHLNFERFTLWAWDNSVLFISHAWCAILTKDWMPQSILKWTVFIYETGLVVLIKRSLCPIPLSVQFVQKSFSLFVIIFIPWTPYENKLYLIFDWMCYSNSADECVM